MTNREFLQEIIRRATADLSTSELKELAATMPANKIQAAIEFDQPLATWFSTECVINDVSLAWELLEIVKDAERGLVIINTKEADASEDK